MHSKLLSLFALLSLATACGDGNSKKDPEPTPQQDAGKTGGEVDSGKSEVDASDEPSDCDKPNTPGNDCKTAVGCREAPQCGLNTQSCCVPGFDIPNVKCVDGVTCEGTAGRANCDGPEDCGGRACCVDTIKGTTNCLDACGTQIALCHTDDDCEAGKLCNAGGSFTWWGICN